MKSNVGVLGKPFPKSLVCAVRESQVDCRIQKQVFVVCPKESCNALYKVGEANSCTHTSYGKVCGTLLGYTAHLSHGKKKWKPHKRFQFVPPSASLKKLFTSQEFNSLLEMKKANWNDVMEDVHHGQIWKDFTAAHFFDSKYNIALMLNVDWFHPFKKSKYKVDMHEIS